MKIFLSIFCLIFFCFSNVFAQENNHLIEQIANDIADNFSDEEVDFEELIIQLQDLANNPIDINSASFEDLKQLKFLSSKQIFNIIEYRNRVHQLYTLYELQYIENISYEDFQILKNFLRIEKKEQTRNYSLKQMFSYGKHTVLNITRFNAETPDEITNGKYLGDKVYSVLKYKYKFKDRLSFGFTMEKDPGEKLAFNKDTKLFDFNSFYVQVGGYKHLKSLIVGDYIIKAGQGLVVSGGFSTGKTSMVLDNDRIPDQVRPYSSSNENQFFRGITANLKFNKFSFIPFVSYHKKDASFDDSLTFKSLKTDGYHRSPKEITSKDNVQNFLCGLISSYKSGSFYVGLTNLYTHFDKDYMPEQLPYNKFLPTGNQFFYNSLNYKYNYKRMLFFGETAFDNNFNFSTIDGATISCANFLDVSLIYRNYSKKYYSFYANAFGEGSRTNNEEGLYFGFMLLPLRMLKISAYMDMSDYNYFSYQVNHPVNNSDYLLKLDFTPNRKYNLILQYKNKAKEDIYEKQNFKLQSYYKPNSQIWLKSSAYFSIYEKENNVDKGMVFVQEFKYGFANFPLNLSALYAVFDAPYNARMYNYESDLLYQFSVPAYYYKGVRYCLKLDYRPIDRLLFQFKFSKFHYLENKDRTEFKFLVQIKF